MLVNDAVTSHQMTGVAYWPASSVAYRIVGMHEANVDRYAPMFAVVTTRIARNRPSLSQAISACVTWSRPWASETNASPRSAAHLIGRFTRLLAHTIAVSSAYR